MQQNDLMIDCLADGADESYLLDFVAGALYFCDSDNQLPCREGHPRCYNISQICQYQLNSAGLLVPCRAGEHMEECSEFECNMMFKCPDFYCIPWKLVCNGKWDCPFGDDELIHYHCQQNRECVLMYRCKSTQICVHLGTVCDTHFDCPLREDESLCSLSDTKCPLFCECLTYAIYCESVTIEDWRAEIYCFIPDVVCHKFKSGATI